MNTLLISLLAGLPMDLSRVIPVIISQIMGAVSVLASSITTLLLVLI